MTAETISRVLVVSLMCQAFAGVFIVFFTTMLSILIAALLEHKRALKMDQEYDELADSREVFWGALHLAYGRFRDLNPQAPERLQDLILADKLPPSFKPREVKDPAQWLKKNGDELNEFTLWEFASSMYPSRQGDPVHGLIDPEYTVSFHEARGKLARFWNRWMPLNEWLYFMVYFKSMRYLCKHYALARNQLIMLTWLELAIIRQVKDHARREIALFRIAAEIAKMPDYT